MGKYTLCNIEEKRSLMKQIPIKEEYITLGKFLKYVGILNNGGEIKSFLLSNDILVNDTPEKRRGRKLRNNDKVNVGGSVYEVVSDVH